MVRIMKIQRHAQTRTPTPLLANSRASQKTPNTPCHSNSDATPGTAATPRGGRRCARFNGSGARPTANFSSEQQATLGGSSALGMAPTPDSFPTHPLFVSFLLLPSATRLSAGAEQRRRSRKKKSKRGERNQTWEHIPQTPKVIGQTLLSTENSEFKRLRQAAGNADTHSLPRSTRPCSQFVPFWFGGGQRLAIRFHPFPFSFENRNGRKQKQAKKKPDQTKETKKGKHGAEARQRGTAKAQQRTEAEPWPGVLQHKWMQTHPAKAHKKAGPIRFFPSPGACDGTQPVRTQPHTPEGENTIFRFHSTHTHTHTTCTTPRIEYRQRKNEGNTQQHNITTRNKTRPQAPTT